MDRLAASRAQRGQAVEMSNLSQDSPAVSDTSAFLAEDASIQRGIQQVRDNISQLSSIRAQTLDAIDEPSSAMLAKVNSLTTEIRTLMQELKQRITSLASTTTKADTLRINRIGLLRSKFLETIREFQQVEQEGRTKARSRVERQLKIVKPDATQEEISAAVEGGGQQIFAQALTVSTRYEESRAAYREVQDRQQDLLRVEQTLAELAQLFTDTANLVEAQGAVIDAVDATAGGVQDEVETGLKLTDQAVVHARSYRKGRWICFFITLGGLAILAIVLGIVFGKK